MPGVLEALELEVEAAEAQILEPGHGFTVLSQKLEFDVDFASRTMVGKTEITIQPTMKELKTISLNCRQCKSIRASVEGRQAPIDHVDPYSGLSLYPTVTVNQHHFLRARIDRLRAQKHEELTIDIPMGVQIEELDPNSPQAAEILLSRTTGGRGDEVDGNVGGDSTLLKMDDKGGPLFRPLRVNITFQLADIRDGLHFAGIEDGDCKYPHAYTRNSALPGRASCVFPCVDSASSRCPWEISVRCHKTLGDAFPKSELPDPRVPETTLRNGLSPHDSVHEALPDLMDLDEEEKNLDLVVICSGEMADEVADLSDASKKIVSFSCLEPVAAHHIGFAIGPFEHIDLSEYRESDQDDMLGSNAIRVSAFALPGRAEEVRNTCMTLPSATDYFVINFEDSTTEVVDTASLTICSTRLLYPEKILDSLDTVTRTLTNALANQWIGVHVIPSQPEDWWVVVGGALFMTDMFLQTLFGKNDYRFRQKSYADRVAELDVKRPSVYDLGKILFVDPEELDFMKLKAPAILFILNQRLIKASGRNGVPRCIHRMLLNAKTGTLQNGEISTASFMHICEKIGHMKLDVFFRQWVYGAGCPLFFVSQRFNKKKMNVEINIRQSQMQQAEASPDENLTSLNFMREVKEENHQAYAGPVQPVFTGPMTVRIHEADGTPYEHIIDIKDVTTKAEIPYHTKYKRLKRSKRAKERAAAAAGIDVGGDNENDVLIYCLGDVLQTEDEMRDWSLVDWPKDDEDKMGQESYEWIRMDADFEWLGRIQVAMEDYMFVSQLQQDKDVVAQVDSVRWLSAAHRLLKPLYSTILTRTLADSRYYHGIRTMAANALVTFATTRNDCNFVGKTHLKKAFTEMFCNQVNGSAVSRMNDFSNRAAYIIKLSIIKAMARIKDDNGQAPSDISHFFLDRLRDNDNSENDFSDNFYVAGLMDALAETLRVPRVNSDDLQAEIDDLDVLESANNLFSRYQRSDEWIPSFQNVYTITALQCQLKLMVRGAIPRRMSEFMQYTRPGNSDLVRLKALGCLTQFGMLRNSAFVKFLVHQLEADPSPFVREQAYQILGRGLGQFATGELTIESRPVRPTNVQNVGFVVEQEMTAETNPEGVEQRNKSLDLAKSGLKQDLGNNEVLKTAMESALRSSITGVKEIEDLLDVCGLLYDTVDKLVIKVRMPRYWRVTYAGEGRLIFTESERVLPGQLAIPDGSIIPTVEPIPPVGSQVAPSPLAETKPLKIKFSTRPSDTGVSTAAPVKRLRDWETQSSKPLKTPKPRSSGSHNLPPPSTPAPPHITTQQRSNSKTAATPPTASAAAAAFGAIGLPPAKRQKMSPPKFDTKVRTPTNAPPPAFASAAAALMGGATGATQSTQMPETKTPKLKLNFGRKPSQPQ
ncbi:hypothetical protein EJ05DRAFT_494569 [Pseudovirgaria hyperparasitica]|uniref:Transcription initiation factor TFIID subunit 2 n=1 Tax=Pseudovirgaria hyperparasitica TaxID=470096 RepID=A0A6A6VVD8_9PEZI|nr:uncharacterized protein EJ05DRAFT_494569 [Pseudovirgaria hyperparasitica]KAF2754193.1 hypothetical protein EJ05DRAFT_494569 [Pseudovirgaria hyperparasitica]